MSLLTDLGVSPEAIASVCGRWAIVELAIFGSAARGELRPDSDVDVLVEFAPGARRSLADIVEIQGQLAALFGRRVDIVEPRALRNPYVRATVMRDRRVLYAA